MSKDFFKRHVLTFALATLYLFLAVCYTSGMERRNTGTLTGQLRPVVKAHNCPISNSPAKPKFQRIFKTIISKEKRSDYGLLLIGLIAVICCKNMLTGRPAVLISLQTAGFNVTPRHLIQLSALRI